MYTFQFNIYTGYIYRYSIPVCHSSAYFISPPHNIVYNIVFWGTTRGRGELPRRGGIHRHVNHIGCDARWPVVLSDALGHLRSN
jgi:hypothetical protein